MTADQAPPSILALNTSRTGASAISLGNLFQQSVCHHPTTLHVRYASALCAVLSSASFALRYVGCSTSYIHRLLCYAPALLLLTISRRFQYLYPEINVFIAYLKYQTAFDAKFFSSCFSATLNLAYLLLWFSTPPPWAISAFLITWFQAVISMYRDYKLLLNKNLHATTFATLPRLLEVTCINTLLLVCCSPKISIVRFSYHTVCVLCLQSL